MSESITTAEVTTVFVLSGGPPLFGFTVITDRKQGRSGLTKGRKLGTIVHQTLPGLLRNVAQLCEEQGGTLADLARVMDKK